MKRFSLRLEDELHKKIKEYSFFNDVSMNDTIVKQMEKFIDGAKDTEIDKK